MFKSFIKQTPFGLSLILLLVAIGVLLVILPINGSKSLIVRSGSMEPTVATGDLVLVYPQQSYKAGDIIAFKDPVKQSTTVTHRIQSIQKQGTKIFFETKGDANEEADFNFVPKQNVIGKANYSIVGIGKLLAFAKTKEGFITFAAIPALFVIFLETLNIVKEIKKSKKPTARQVYKIAVRKLYTHYGKPMGVPHNSASYSSLYKLVSHKFKGADQAFKRHVNFNQGGISFRSLLPFAAAVFVIGNTYAFAGDTESTTGNLLQAAAVFPINGSGSPSPSPTPTPPPIQIEGGVIINEINWGGAVGDGNDEWIELRNTSAGTIDISGWIVENLGIGSGPGANMTIPASSSIPAGGFYLIANNIKSNSKVNVDPDFVDTSVSLVDGGEQLILKDNFNVVKDTANGTGAWLAGTNSVPKKSMERTGPGDGTQAGNWTTATTHTNMDASGPDDGFGTPKAPNGI